MASTTNKIADKDPVNLIEVLTAELEHIGPDPDREEPNREKHIDAAGDDKSSKLNSIFQKLHLRGFKALCFSGGGIRSATFGLGIVEALAEKGLLDKFDYLSTVSGGGYLGSWLSAWIRREQLKLCEKDLKPLLEKKEKTAQDLAKIAELQKEVYAKYQRQSDYGVRAVQDKLKEDAPHPGSDFDPGIEPKQFQFLREYSNYMTPKVGLLSADTWTFLSIYLRNLFLNWTIFVPLIASVLLVPRVLLAIVQHPEVIPLSTQTLSLIAFIAGTLTLFVVIISLPSANAQVDKPAWGTDGGVVTFAVAPLLIMAFIITTLIIWFLNDLDYGNFNFFPLNDRNAAFWLGALPVLTYVTLKILVFAAGFIKYIALGDRTHTAREFWKRLNLARLLGTAASAAGASVIGAFILGKVFDAVRTVDNGVGREHLLAQQADFYVALAVPALLLIFIIAATMFVGFASKVESDGDREWFARFGAWILIACVGWIFLSAISFGGPWAITQIHLGITTLGDMSLKNLGAKVASVVGVISGALSLIGGYTGKSSATDAPADGRLTKILSVAPKIAAVIFLAFILTGISALAVGLGDRFHEGLNGIAAWANLRPQSESMSDVTFTLIYAVTVFLASLVMACLINVNKFSLHGAYRDRLIRAYLGASKVERKADPFTGFDDMDNFQLHRLKGQRPFHVINATLNLVDGDKLAWQNRKAASFIMTPLHCGSWALEGYRNTFEYSRNKDLGVCSGLDACNYPGDHCTSIEQCKYPGKSLRIGTAMAISGAAVNPNMGYYSSPVVMFLMAMFNIRLGWWLGNTNVKGGQKWLRSRFYEKPSPTIAILPLISETFGRTDKDRRFVNVSDGGHFENLGLYEIVVRRCKFIVVSDAGADDKFAFDDLANAIEKCEVDLGVKIEFEEGIKIPARSAKNEKTKSEKTEKKREEPNIRYAVARIRYPENAGRNAEEDGLLLYVKPSFQGDEPIELKHYADANPTFPHQSTGDQMFDEKQFEAYRELGYFTMKKILDRMPSLVAGDLKTLVAGVRTIADKKVVDASGPKTELS